MDETGHRMIWGKYCILSREFTYFFFKTENYLASELGKVKKHGPWNTGYGACTIIISSTGFFMIGYKR